MKLFSKIQETSEPSRVHEHGLRPPAVVDASRPGAWERVGGMPLLARILRELARLKFGKIVVLSSIREFPEEVNKCQGLFTAYYLTASDDVPAILEGVVGLEQPFLYVDAAHLIDSRLITALATASASTLAYISPEDRERRMIRAGFLTPEDLRLWVEQGNGPVVQKARVLLPEGVDPFSPMIRGPLTPCFVEVRSREEARKATRILIRSQKKKVMDFPAEYLDPPFQYALTLILCETPVTPNMVTLGGALVGMLAAWCFWHGLFVTGALLTFPVEILDGVDGMLARTKMHYSKLGQYEDVIDYFYENSWYVALAAGLSATVSGPLPVLLAALLIFSDTLDNIFYTLAGKWHGKSIDLFSPFDEAFRRIAGRRNIYGFMFIVGFILGYPFYTFAAAAGWAALTAGVHGLRLVQGGWTATKTRGPEAERSG